MAGKSPQPSHEPPFQAPVNTDRISGRKEKREGGGERRQTVANKLAAWAAPRQPLKLLKQPEKTSNTSCSHSANENTNTHWNEAILVPRAHDPSGLWQGSRALVWSNTGSPRFTDLLSNLANLIGWEFETNTLRMLRKLGPARALDPCHRPEGSWALGTRMKWSWNQPCEPALEHTTADQEVARLARGG